jgi:hypothetical protein
MDSTSGLLMRAATMKDHPEPRRRQDGMATVDTYVWIDEYQFLYVIYDSVRNTSPRFRFPDLISACVSLVFMGENPAERIFDYLRSQLVLRPDSERRREALWKPQYELLLGLQRSAENRHPHPQFQLDQFTTACVALVMKEDDCADKMRERARRNTAERTTMNHPSRASAPVSVRN